MRWLASLETSPSCMPASSLYWSQMSLSMISAAATKRRMAASPLLREPCFSCANAGTLLLRRAAPAVAAAPATIVFLRNERRLEGRATTLSCDSVVPRAGLLTSLLMIPHSDFVELNSAISAGNRVTVEGRVRADLRAHVTSTSEDCKKMVGSDGAKRKLEVSNSGEALQALD